jgi:hypothetical protein
LIAVLDIEKLLFKGNFATEELALKAIHSGRFNSYILDDPMTLVNYETFSMRELCELLKQFETDTSQAILNDRATLVSRLWQHWKDQGVGLYRKKRAEKK